MAITANLSSHRNLVSAREALTPGHICFQDENGTSPLFLHGMPPNVGAAVVEAFNREMGVHKCMLAFAGDEVDMESKEPTVDHLRDPIDISEYWQEFYLSQNPSFKGEYEPTAHAYFDLGTHKYGPIPTFNGLKLQFQSGEKPQFFSEDEILLAFDLDEAAEFLTRMEDWYEGTLPE